MKKLIREVRRNPSADFTKLQNKEISCKDVTFTIFGVSLATINTFISAFLTTITLFIFIKYEKKR